jgi:hypothetical protein
MTRTSSGRRTQPKRGRHHRASNFGGRRGGKPSGLGLASQLAGLALVHPEEVFGHQVHQEVPSGVRSTLDRSEPLRWMNPLAGHCRRTVTYPAGSACASTAIGTAPDRAVRDCRRYVHINGSTPPRWRSSLVLYRRSPAVGNGKPVPQGARGAAATPATLCAPGDGVGSRVHQRGDPPRCRSDRRRPPAGSVQPAICGPAPSSTSPDPSLRTSRHDDEADCWPSRIASGGVATRGRTGRLRTAKRGVGRCRRWRPSRPRGWLAAGAGTPAGGHRGTRSARSHQLGR